MAITQDKTRLGTYGGPSVPYGAFAPKAAGAGTTLIILARSISRFTFTRIFGRVN